MLEVTSLDALQKILGAPDRLEKRKEFEKYVTNESTYVLEYMVDSNKDGWSSVPIVKLFAGKFKMKKFLYLL